MRILSVNSTFPASTPGFESICELARPRSPHPACQQPEKSAVNSAGIWTPQRNRVFVTHLQEIITGRDVRRERQIRFPVGRGAGSWVCRIQWGDFPGLRPAPGFRSHLWPD